MAVSEEKLSELEEALAELGKDDDEVSVVLRRFEGGQRTDLAAADQELEALAEGANIASIVGSPDPGLAQDAWDGENTEVEIIDPSDDFVLLVDEDDFEELDEVANKIPQVTMPPPLPGRKVAQGESEEDDEDEGFFKKLFGSRRSSNRP